MLQDQQNEIDAYHIYSRLSKKTKDDHNAKILQSIASDEINHYHILKGYTKKEITPSKGKIFLYVFLARFLGFTFALKLLENAEQKAQDDYNNNYFNCYQ